MVIFKNSNNMKKFSLILLMALSIASCDKYEPLHFPRTPYDGDELRTDGFWYNIHYSQYDWKPDCMNLYYMYRDGVYLFAATVNTTNPSEITVDCITHQGHNNFNNQILWGVFVVEGDTLKWSEWFWPSMGSGVACLYTFEIVNDTCIKRTGEEDYFYFHPFDYKPDSTIARQWIP